ncbi:MAG: hypothetical protein KAI02_04235 [Gammaproteobacteria bacterium]|nr:hypothetical protein [Gammaproteobacteria bacterium]
MKNKYYLETFILLIMMFFFIITANAQTIADDINIYRDKENNSWDGGLKPNPFLDKISDSDDMTRASEGKNFQTPFSSYRCDEQGYITYCSNSETHLENDSSSSYIDGLLQKMANDSKSPIYNNKYTEVGCSSTGYYAQNNPSNSLITTQQETKTTTTTKTKINPTDLVTTQTETKTTTTTKTKVKTTELVTTQTVTTTTTTTKTKPTGVEGEEDEILEEIVTVDQETLTVANDTPLGSDISTSTETEGPDAHHITTVILTVTETLVAQSTVESGDDEIIEETVNVTTSTTIVPNDTPLGSDSNTETNTEGPDENQITTVTLTVTDTLVTQSISGGGDDEIIEETVNVTTSTTIVSNDTPLGSDSNTETNTEGPDENNIVIVTVTVTETLVKQEVATDTVTVIYHSNAVCAFKNTGPTDTSAYTWDRNTLVMHLPAVKISENEFYRVRLYERSNENVEVRNYALLHPDQVYGKIYHATYEYGILTIPKLEITEWKIGFTTTTRIYRATFEDVGLLEFRLLSLEPYIEIEE